jgi:predicted RNA-binding protein with RPS1 domain
LNHLVGQNRNEVRCEVSGPINPKKEYVTWIKRKLKVGDDVRLRVIETAATDHPETRIDLPKVTIREDPNEEIRNQKRYVREMARKFGWKIAMGRKGVLRMFSRLRRSDWNAGQQSKDVAEDGTSSILACRKAIFSETRLSVILRKSHPAALHRPNGFGRPGDCSGQPSIWHAIMNVE